MSKKKYNLVSIGSGSAGRRVAVALKNAGWDTAIIEKDVSTHFGGTCICTGCIPTKALIEKAKTAETYSGAFQHKNMIVERIRTGTLRNAQERVKLDVIPGTASFVDETTVNVFHNSENNPIQAEIFVIATGSYSFIPPLKGINDVEFITSKEALDLQNPPKRLLIIGGGRIGLEIGQMLHNVGTDVTVFEGRSHIFANLEDFEMSDIIENFLVEKGMRIVKGRFVDEVKQSGSGNEKKVTVLIKTENETREYVGDELLIATGRRPNLNELKLENAEVTVKNGAIKVDEYLQTSAQNIFAIGDVIGNPMFTNWASYQSGHLLRNLKFSKTKSTLWEPLPDKTMPRIAFTQPEFASVGLTEEQAKEKYGENVVVYKFKNQWLGKSMIVDDWNGILKAVGLKNSNKIIGAHLWGERTGSLVQMIVLAMDNNLGWNELSDMVYGHPVLAEGIYALASGIKTRT